MLKPETTLQINFTQHHLILNDTNPALEDISYISSFDIQSILVDDLSFLTN
jgi:hypothetical protein